MICAKFLYGLHSFIAIPVPYVKPTEIHTCFQNTSDIQYHLVVVFYVLRCPNVVAQKIKIAGQYKTLIFWI